MRNFLSFLDEIHENYLQTIPAYFYDCVEKLENLTSQESALHKKEKMELSGLLRIIKKYLIQDIYGFNSGILPLLQ